MRKLVEVCIGLLIIGCGGQSAQVIEKVKTVEVPVTKIVPPDNLQLVMEFQSDLEMNIARENECKLIYFGDAPNKFYKVSSINKLATYSFPVPPGSFQISCQIQYGFAYEKPKVDDFSLARFFINGQYIYQFIFNSEYVSLYTFTDQGDHYKVERAGQ